MDEPQITTSVLFTSFLGLTEKQIDVNNPFGSDLNKTVKQNLPENMQIIQYMLSQIQYFEVIIDKDQDDIVVSQKTYWPDIENYYMLMKKRAIPGLKCGYSEGFYVQAPQFDKILFEMVVLPDKTRCIMTSI